MNTDALHHSIERHLNYLRQDPKNCSLLQRLSEDYYCLGDWDNAQHYLNLAKEISQDAHWMLQGYIHLGRNQCTEAKACFTQALAEEESASNRFNLAFCAYHNHEFALALEILKGMQHHAPLFEAEMLKARLLHHLKQIEEAIALLEEIDRTYNNEPQAAGMLALIYFDNGHIEQAHAYCDKALNLDPTQQEARLTKLLIRTLHQEDTLSEITDLIQNNPHECRLWYALGTQHLGAMNIDKALHAFTQTTNLAPHVYEAWINTAWCHLLQNNTKDAKKAYQNAATADANHSEANAGLALVYALEQDTKSAHLWLTKAKTQNEECFLAQIAQIILANQEHPDQSATQFLTTFPEIKNKILAASIEVMAMSEERNE